MSVRLINISKEFPDPEREGGRVLAVRDFNLEVAEGEFVTLLGPSGCGKTTTLRIIAGFETPTTGEVWINGKNVNNDPPNKRDTSMVFQSYAIFPHMSVEQNVGFGLELKGRPKAEISREVRQIMEVMGIADLAHRRPDQLSGGQQQRVALARSIINKPSVLLFDEPLSNLDAKLREQMRVEIRRIQQTFKITSVYVTHDQVEAMTVSDRIVVMDKGYMMQIGTPFEIYSRPSNRFVADFIGKVNLLPVRFEREDSGRYFAKDERGLHFEAMSAVPGLKSGQEALFMLRPESLSVESEESTSSSELERMILARGIVDKAVYLGSTVEYEIDVSLDRPMLAVSHDPVNVGFWKPGDSVILRYSPRAAHLLPLVSL
ncbi:MAG: ABC transporter ATP-binding protein [Rectinema sp.]|jgi:iron(III) transport system ATP-binding protein